MELVQFISCEDDGTDRIVSFALAYGEMEIRSLTLLRTPKYEAMLDECVLRGLDETGDDLMDWPGAAREDALYSVGPCLDALFESATPEFRSVTPGLEDAVWPDVEAWIEAGRRTAPRAESPNRSRCRG